MVAALVPHPDDAVLRPDGGSHGGETLGVRIERGVYTSAGISDGRCHADVGVCYQALMPSIAPLKKQQVYAWRCSGELQARKPRVLGERIKAKTKPWASYVLLEVVREPSAKGS
jgi:hypothetical protein